MFFMSARKARKETKRGKIRHVESCIRISAQSGDNYTVFFSDIPEFIKIKLKLKGYKVIETNNGIRIEW